jgi:hypothetical protein
MTTLRFGEVSRRSDGASLACQPPRLDRALEPPDGK